jgi:hypothetical protein
MASPFSSPRMTSTGTPSTSTRSTTTSRTSSSARRRNSRAGPGRDRGCRLDTVGEELQLICGAHVLSVNPEEYK